MVLGPSGRDHDSPNQLFLIWEAPRYFINIKTTTQTLFKNVILGNMRISKLENVGNQCSRIVEILDL